MADDEGIKGIYWISGIRKIGTAHVYPKSRVVKKADAPEREERESYKNPKEKKPQTSSKKNKRVDIKV